MPPSLDEELHQKLARMQRIAAEEEARERRTYHARKRVREGRERVAALVAGKLGALKKALSPASLFGEPKPKRARPAKAKSVARASVQPQRISEPVPAGMAPPRAETAPRRAEPRLETPRPAAFVPPVIAPDRNGRVPFTAQPPESRRNRRSDLTVAALGVTLGLICALFPWYIFLNPEEFGIRALRFFGDGTYEMGEVVPIAPQPQRVGAPSEAEPIPPEKLDLFATGTTPAADEKPAEPATQPFPAAPAHYRVVHVSNGRAMLEDEGGLFVVSRGSVLPDNSKVAAIEQRGGKWVLVTDAGGVIAIGETGGH